MKTVCDPLSECPPQRASLPQFELSAACAHAWLLVTRLCFGFLSRNGSTVYTRGQAFRFIPPLKMLPLTAIVGPDAGALLAWPSFIIIIIILPFCFGTILVLS